MIYKVPNEPLHYVKTYVEDCTTVPAKTSRFGTVRYEYLPRAPARQRSHTSPPPGHSSTPRAITTATHDYQQGIAYAEKLPNALAPIYTNTTVSHRSVGPVATGFRLPAHLRRTWDQPGIVLKLEVCLASPNSLQTRYTHAAAATAASASRGDLPVSMAFQIDFQIPYLSTC